MSRLPRGCDQQGRYPEAAEAPAPAEAATEIGAEQDRYERAYWEDLKLACAMTAIVAVVFLVVLLAWGGR